jgi:two-component system sensor histidine kinase PilS (NtrC family)
LSRLLTEFLEFSTVKIGQRGEVDLALLIRECIALVEQHPAAAEGVRIEGVGTESEVKIPGDADLLHRVLFNLLLNAVQFAGQDGLVRVELQDKPDAATRRSAVASPIRFSVRDSGPGIDPKDLMRVFDPFYTTREGGSGMGLALVHRAVEAHHGAVFVEQAPEGGAEFIIYLPRSSDGH